MMSRLTIAICVVLTLSVAATTLSFVLLPFRWPLPEAEVFSGALDLPGSPSGARGAFESAADEWTQKTGFKMNVSPDPVGACNFAGELLNGAEFFSFACDGSLLDQQVLAVTEMLIAQPGVEGGDGELLAFGITFNSALNWALYNGPWRADADDFRRVALHELGHVVALDHEDRPATETIMTSFIGDLDSLQPDDIDAVKERYPELTADDPQGSPQIGLEFDGTAADRVGQGNTALGSDGANDGVFTITLEAGGDRTVSGIMVSRQAGGSWDTDAGTGSWIVGAASTLNGGFLNDLGNGSVNFGLPAGGSFVAFISDVDGLLFTPGTAISVTVMFNDGSSADANLVL